MAPRQVALSSNEPALPFQIRGTSFTLLALKIIDPRDGAFFDRLENTLSLAPGFYRNAPIVLDLSSLNRAAPVDMTGFCRKLRELTLMPVGIQGANAEWEEACLAAGLAVFPAGKAANPSTVRSRSGAQAPKSPSRLVTEPVRSGQRVYAAEADLIVTAPVSRGAELLADGNIHVYAPLRGRALAGMNGDPAARIFCRHLDADLVSIGGFYMVSEQMDPGLIGKAVQISLVGDRLIFDPL